MDSHISRREWIGLLSAGAIGFAAAPQILAQSKTLTPLNRFPRMVQEYFVARVREIERESVARKMALKNKAEAQAYVREVKAKIRSIFGPAPAKTPLNARVAGTVERDAYRIEKIVFESRPGLLVTGNLYLPKGRAFPLPGVVATCGHSTNGKAGDTYQSFTQGLARMGYIVLIIDPIGQGERLQYPDEKLASRIGNGVQEHLYLGHQQLPVGENFPFWRAWDGIRALDYLLTRPEVDPQRIGVTGNSGGGTITTWLCGLDDRWAMAAPGCFVTTVRRNLENELPQDSEQYPLRMLALGLDHDDFIAAMAPKPVILLAKEKDYFDVRGVEEAYARLKRLYKLLGAEENIGLFVGPTYHGYSKENREAMYRWFNRVTKISTATTEPELALEKDETLQCTPRGQVAELGSRTVFSFTAEKSKELSRKRASLADQELKQAIADTLKLRFRPGAPDARILNRLTNRQYPKKEFTTYAVETEPHIQAIVYRLSDAVLYSRPSSGRKRAVLYVSHLSSDDELRHEPLIGELLAAESEAEFYTCDVRGSGESQPDTCGENSFLMPYGSDYFYAGHAMMLDYPYVGQKTFDILRVLDWLRSYGHEEIHLAAKGRGTIPATFAAVLGNTVAQVTLKHALTSYSDLAETEFYQCPLSCIVPNVLAKFDLPDCYRVLEKKKLRLIEARNTI